MPGCDGGRKNSIAYHGRRGCHGCGTQPVADGGNGKGGCTLGTHDSCSCTWHTKREEREIWKVCCLTSTISPCRKKLVVVISASTIASLVKYQGLFKKNAA